MEELNRQEDYREDSNTNTAETPGYEPVQEPESMQMQEPVQRVTEPVTEASGYAAEQNPGMMQQNMSNNTVPRYGNGAQPNYPYGQPMYQNNPYQHPAYQSNP